MVFEEAIEEFQIISNRPISSFNKMKAYEINHNSSYCEKYIDTSR
jgi:hypothetical protein